MSAQGVLPGAVAAQGLEAVDLLLKNRDEIRERIRHGKGLTELARTLLLTAAAGTAVFGAAIGAFRGGPQIAFAALKLPLAMLLTAAVCAPALTALHAAFDRRRDVRRDLALMLASLALASLVLAALAPAVLLAVLAGAGYHHVAVTVVGCCLVAGLTGSVFLARALLVEREGAVPVGMTFLLVFALVGSQMTWTLRPWIVRPRAELELVRLPLEGSLLEAAAISIDSARGVYSRDHAPLPGETPPAPPGPPASGEPRGDLSRQLDVQRVIERGEYTLCAEGCDGVPACIRCEDPTLNDLLPGSRCGLQDVILNRATVGKLTDASDDDALLVFEAGELLGAFRKDTAVRWLAGRPVACNGDKPHWDRVFADNLGTGYEARIDEEPDRRRWHIEPEDYLGAEHGVRIDPDPIRRSRGPRAIVLRGGVVFRGGNAVLTREVEAMVRSGR